MKIQLSTIFRNEKKFLLLVFFLALLLRLFYVYYRYPPNIRAYTDMVAYKHYAEEILKQGIFVPDLNSLGERAGLAGPGIGFILSIIYLVFGTSWLRKFNNTSGFSE